MLWFLVSVAGAADNAALRAGLDDPSGWEEIDRKAIDGVGEVLVRHKKVAGTDCLEGSTTTIAPPELLLHLASDIPSEIGWSSWKLPASVTLAETPERVDYYQVLDNPSPVSDRYWFLRGTRVRSGDRLMFLWEPLDAASLYPSALDDVREKFPDAVLPDVNMGDWTFERHGSSTFVRYRICTNAGGAIPLWVGEIAAKQTLPTNVGDIIREALRRLNLP